MRKLLVIAVILLSAANLHAQDSYPQRAPIFFAAPAVETVWYGRNPPSMGYGLALGSEGKISMGIKGIYAVPLLGSDLTTFEMTLFFRVYMPRADSGFFAQLTYGTSIFLEGGAVSLPARTGSISIGITSGWRFPLGNRYFIEQYIRIGYPYYGGIGLSAGIKF